MPGKAKIFPMSFLSSFILKKLQAIFSLLRPGPFSPQKRFSTSISSFQNRESACNKTLSLFQKHYFNGTSLQNQAVDQGNQISDLRFGDLCICTDLFAFTPCFLIDQGGEQNHRQIL